MGAAVEAIYRKVLFQFKNYARVAKLNFGTTISYEDKTHEQVGDVRYISSHQTNHTYVQPKHCSEN